MIQLGTKKKSAYTLDEFRLGAEIILNACIEPLRQIAINSGLGDGTRIIEELGMNQNPNSGLSAILGVSIDDMIAVGIIDPLKVTRTALENAASAAGILLTTEVAIAEAPEEKKPSHQHNPEMDY